MNETAQKICPDCKGSGQTGPVHIHWANKPHEWRDSMTCLRCDGAGNITEEMADWIDRGREARDKRVARGLSMLEQARALGLSSSEVSAMEHGRRDPTPLEEGT